MRDEYVPQLPQHSAGCAFCGGAVDLEHVRELRLSELGTVKPAKNVFLLILTRGQMIPRILGWRFLAFIVAGTAASLLAGIAYAQQKFPTKPIRIVASTTAGSQPDGISRLIGQKMSESWGRAVVI